MANVQRLHEQFYQAERSPPRGHWKADSRGGVAADHAVVAQTLGHGLGGSLRDAPALDQPGMGAGE